MKIACTFTSLNVWLLNYPSCIFDILHCMQLRYNSITFWQCKFHFKFPCTRTRLMPDKFPCFQVFTKVL